MKKAKIVLVSLCIVAILGTTFALKAKSFGPNCLYTCNASKVCNKVAFVTAPGTMQASNATIIPCAGATTNWTICNHTIAYALE